jgi:hypothetical protein
VGICSICFSGRGLSAVCKGPPRAAGYTLRFSDESAYAKFLEEFEARGISPSRFFTRVDSRVFPGDLESGDLLTPLLWLQVSSRAQGLGGPRYGTKYDLATGCPKCGTGSHQTSALYVQPRDSPRTSVWETLDNEILVTDRLRTVLKGASGLELRQARSAVDSSPIGWWQVIARYELPPMAQSTEGISRDSRLGCIDCKRDGFGTAASYTIRYEIDLNSVPDVSHTYEHFGRSVLAAPFDRSHFAQPLIVVRDRVFRQLAATGVRNIAAVPIDAVGATAMKSAPRA